MKITEIDQYKNNSDILYFHFDVPDHHLRLSTFIASAQSAQKVLDGFSTSLLDGNLKFELIVVAPQEGSFLKRLVIWVTGGATMFVAFLETDLGKGYFKGLTGKYPTEWTEYLGEQHADLLEGVLEVIPDDPAAKAPLTKEKVCSSLLVQMTKSLFEMDKDTLERTGLSNILPQEALIGRSEFFEACLKDQDVRAIGFSPEDEFPIPRHGFPERAILPERKEDDEIQDPWIAGTETIFVSSPNWDREDQITRQWKGKDSSRRECFFIVQDEQFWRYAEKKNLHVDVLDQLKVQWAYQIRGGRPKNRRVLRVLEFNGDLVSNELSREELSEILGAFETFIRDDRQPSWLDE